MCVSEVELIMPSHNKIITRFQKLAAREWYIYEHNRYKKPLENNAGFGINYGLLLAALSHKTAVNRRNESNGGQFYERPLILLCADRDH